jgi:hypothetical protein
MPTAKKLFHSDLTPSEMNKALHIVNKRVSKTLNIHVEPNFDLRKSREVQSQVAKEHNSWSLLINKDGTLCYAIEPSGLRIGPFTSPHYLKAVVEEHIINYFINTLREKLPKF